MDKLADITEVNTHWLSKSPELAVASCSIPLIKYVMVVIRKCKSVVRCRAWILCVYLEDLVVHFAPHLSC